MKLVKLKINNRADRIVNFDASKDNQNNHYVIRLEDGAGEYNLLSISKKMAPYNTDIYVNSYTLTQDVNDNYELNIMLDDKPDPKDSQVDSDYDFSINTEDKGNEVLFYVTNLDKNTSLKVNLVLGKKTKTVFINFEELVFDAIIDFGSEASQACWKMDRNKNNINITEAILVERAEQLKKKGVQQVENNDKLSDYIQYESNNLYRSIYYMKKRLESSDISAWPDYTDDTIRFLMKNNEDINKEELMLIPNTKILFFDMSKYIEENVKIKNTPVSIANLNGDGVIQRLLMNNIVYQTLLSIQNHTETLGGSRCKKGSVVLNVLMPNIYPIHVVTRKLNVLAEDIATLLKKEDSRFTNINMVELRAVSESDASLLGYLNTIRDKNLAINEGNFLIIDAGKGTLDMSLMQVSADGYVNKSRAGIVGAGNAVTYGVMLALVNEYLSSVCDEEIDATKIRRFIHGKILFKGNRDVASINRIMRRIEEYKRIYNNAKRHGKETPERAVDELTSFEQIMNDADRFARFERWIEEINSKKAVISKASSRFIDAEIDSIVNEMIVPVANMLENKGKLENANNGKRKKQVQNNEPASGIHVSTVVFTGRGCLMNELREKIMVRLKAERLVDETANVIVPNDSDPDYMKTICLNIFEILNGDSYDSSPYMQTCSVLDPVTGATSGTPKPAKQNTFDPFADEYFGRGGYVSNGSIKGNIEDGISVGTINTANSRLTIGGWMYTIKKEFQGKQCRIYFDGLDTWLITEDPHDASSIRLNDNNMEALYRPRLGFESLFPNVMTDDESLIAVPEFNENAEKEEEYYDDDNDNDGGNVADEFEKVEENIDNQGGFFHALKNLWKSVKK